MTDSALFHIGSKQASLKSLILSTLLASTAVITALMSVGNYAFAADDNWYVGKGAKADMYVTYRIQDLDTNNGTPLELTIYFQNQDDNGNWIAPVYVVDQGRVFSGTLKLSPVDLSVLGSGSDIPKDLMPYINAYKDSLQWLSAYVPKPGQSLSSASWGKIASIGGSEIKPSGTEKITVKGGTFDTTKIVYHKAVDSIIWIGSDFPLPIKAQTYADVTTGSPPTQYAFELLATGTGKPPTPTPTVDIPKPPLEQRTARGTYFVDLDWSPAEIQPSKEIAFNISFFDSRHAPVQNVNYDFTITDSQGKVMTDRKSQFAAASPVNQTVTFDENSAGPATVEVAINGVGSRDPGPFVESAQFNIIAVPEFPVGILGVGTAALIGVVFVLTRFMRGRLTNLGDT